MTETVLVTGGAGFVGSHLIDYILAQPGNWQIVSLSNTASANLDHLQDEPRLKCYDVNMQDRAALTALVADLRPARIFHLAARSFINESFADPVTTLENNLHAPLNLFEAVRSCNLVEQTLILNVGSSDEYGFIRPEDLPINESTPFRPGNPYAVSKITQEMLGYQYYRSYDLKIVATRAFNQVGPRQSDQLAASAFARQVAMAEAGRIEPVIRVGNLEASRDYTDVRDVVRGYWLALEKGQPGEVYNLCSGRSHRMKDVLDTLISMADCPLRVEFDPARARPSDMPVSYGDYSKFHEATGWEPHIPFEQSLRDLLNYWRETIRKES